MTTIVMALLLGAATADAREGDEAACEGLVEGDDCTRANGDAGLCQPDDSDPEVLVCDDDGLGSSDGSGSSDCSTAGSSAAGWLALGLVAVGSRRRIRIGAAPAPVGRGPR